MKESTVFTQNLLKLYEKSGLNAKSLTELVNLRVGEKVIDHSYVARMIKTAKDGNDVNPSLDKASALAIGFNHNLAEMLSYNCGNNNTQSFNTDSLVKAYMNVESFCDHLNITQPEFKARALEIQYSTILDGDLVAGQAKLHLLAKEFDL